MVTTMCHNPLMPYYIHESGRKIVYRSKFRHAVRQVLRFAAGCAVLWGLWELWCLLLWLSTLVLRP